MRFPIWPCSVRGFACRPCCHGRGALLPHLFTLTRLRPLRGFGGAVCFLCHFPSSCPDRALPGALPCGVRTFLSSSDGRSSGLLRRLSVDLLVDSVLLQFLVQVAARCPDHLGGLRDVPVVL